MNLILSLLILSFLSTLFSLWWYQHSRHLVDMSSAGNDYDVISLDDDRSTHRSELRQSSPLPILISSILTVMFLLMYLISRAPRTYHDLVLTYTEFGVRKMGEYLAEELPRKQMKTLVIVPPSSDQGEFVHPLIKNLKKGFGNLAIFVGVESPPTDLEKATPSLFGSNNIQLDWRVLNNMAASYDDVELIISLVGLSGNIQEIGQSSFPRTPYVAIYSPQPRLNDFVDLVHTGMVDLVLVSTGKGGPEKLIPKDVRLDDILDQNFLLISSKNVKEIAVKYRQYIGPFKE
jgi:hypothetical protein